jgi:hypothetical protein
VLLGNQRDQVHVEPQDYKTSASSQEKNSVFAVDIDGVIKDLEHLDRVNYLPHNRDHIDWRQVWTMRLGDTWVRPSQTQKKRYTWQELADMQRVPMEWLRKHSNKMLEAAIHKNNGFDFELSKQDLVPLKGKMFIPRAVQQLFTTQEILQD